MSEYYTDKLSAIKLKKCYDIASPRVQQYLQAEIDYVLQKVQSGHIVLELGCGYGRVLSRLVQYARLIIGIDTSPDSLTLARHILGSRGTYLLVNMNAAHLGFRDKVFDCVVCIQNGISAFNVDQRELIRESVRVTRSGGTVLFSSYSDKFWNERLVWFQQQTEANLLGEIDYSKTGNGTIVCKDGFIATTVRPHEFNSLTRGLDADITIDEVDESSLFCEIKPH
jgi:2-polyprenyl-6-hydroxyphenyl methylase/3-demethylubiquinone-9 3-methyltransferase